MSVSDGSWVEVEEKKVEDLSELHLCPSSRPGSLKRGMTSVVEESTMKRSRTSSISSGSGVPTPRGTPGTKRNPISSSHSSSLGLPQVLPVHLVLVAHMCTRGVNHWLHQEYIISICLDDTVFANISKSVMKQF